MKILVFSDSHLTHTFDSEWFDYIVKLVKKADQVVINGDFWDAFLTTFDSFCQSEWQRLFPLLKEKDTIYVLGNHDKEEYMDDRVNLFSNIQTTKYILKSGSNVFHFQHGHLIAPAYDVIPLLSNQNLVRPFYKIVMGILAANRGIRKIQHGIEYSDGLKKLQKYVEYVSSSFEKNNYYIFGHSHVHKTVSEFNISNLGVFQPKRRHFLFIEDGKIHTFPEKQQFEE